MDSRTLNHLRALKAESIHITREVVAEFAKPVMLCAIGKDSSVRVRLAQKTFFPGSASKLLMSSRNCSNSGISSLGILARGRSGLTNFDGIRQAAYP